MKASPQAGALGQPFTERVLVLFMAQGVTAAVGILNGLILAHLLGPGGKGDYYLLTLLPATVMVLIQLGLPQAFGFFAARGESDGLTAKSVVLAAAIALPALGLAIAFLPALQATFMTGLASDEIVFALLALPIALNASFTTGIVLGNQAVRWYAGVNIARTIAYGILLVIAVALLGLGLVGALGVFLVITCFQAGGFLIAASRVAVHRQPGRSVAVLDLLRYGLPLHAGAIAQFFSQRADVFMLALFVAQPSVPLGYYSLAVSMAEMVFFFPNAVSTLLFPHVAGSARADSDRQAPLVSRVNLLVTAGIGLALVPAATVLISTLLPAFVPALPAFYVLLPGVVALSVAKVSSGYLTGLGRTGLTSAVNVASFGLNVAANLALIPRFGILGAAASSLISYAASSIAFTLIAARLASASWLDFWIPRWTDVQVSAVILVALGHRLVRKAGNRP